MVGSGPQQLVNSAGNSQTLSSTPSSSSGQLPPVFRSVSANRKHNVRIVLADLQRQSPPSCKVSFVEKAQVFVPVTEVLANVSYITSEVNKEWPNMNLTIVTNDGLPLIDSDGTRG